jgi:hypothetical protein
MDIIHRLRILSAKADPLEEALLIDEAAEEITRLRKQIPAGYKVVPIETESDAEKYRWIKQNCTRNILDMGGNHYWRLHSSSFVMRGLTLDDAIDKAMVAASPLIEGK